MLKQNRRETFISKAEKRQHGIRYGYDLILEYNGGKNKYTIVCPKHGPFEQSGEKHLLGHGCHQCGIESSAVKRRSSVEELISRLGTIHDGYYTYDPIQITLLYRSQKTLLPITCSKHGEFWQSAVDHLGGHGCIKCGYESNTISQRTNIKTLMADFKSQHGDRYSYDPIRIDAIFQHLKTRIPITCSKHGEFWQASKNHASGQGCPLCADSARWQTRLTNDPEFAQSSALLYLTEMTIIHTGRSFLKVGWTTTTIRQRYSKKQITDHFTILPRFVINTTVEKSYAWEQQILNDFQPNHRYSPNIRFRGHRECLDISVLLTVQEYMADLEFTTPEVTPAPVYRSSRRLITPLLDPIAVNLMKARINGGATVTVSASIKPMKSFTVGSGASLDFLFQ